MSQPEKLSDSHESVSNYTLIQLNQDNKPQSAIGVYKNEEEAFAAALIHQMQSIENNSHKWPKATLVEKQEEIIELCRAIKEDWATYKERFDYMSTQGTKIFQDLFNSHYLILPLLMDNSIPNTFNESVFKTKIRNFLDALQTKSDVEEDLGNSDDEDDEEEELEEEDIEEEDIEDEEEDDIEEEDIEEEEEEDMEEDENEEEDIEEEEDDEEDEMPTSEPIMPELQDSSEEEELEENTLKRKISDLEEEDEEEDEIDDEDELDDDEENVTTKRRRVVVA